MVFVLKLILIILLNNTCALITQDSEIVLLPAWNPTEAKEISLKVFGKLIQLNLHKNDQFVSPAFKIRKNNAKVITENLSKSNSCFYIHEDEVSSAAINICQKHGLEGHIFVENDILEIRSLWNMFAPLPFIDDSCVKQQINQSFGTPHLIKKLQQHFAGSDLCHLHNIKSKRQIDEEQKERYTIKLAVFVDVTAYRTEMCDQFMPLFNISYIYNLMHTYVNNLQSFFHHSSLGVYIDIVLIKLLVMNEELPFSEYICNTVSMLKAFCNFEESLNPPNNDPDHWDIALHVSDIDFHAPAQSPFEGRNYKIAGKAHPNGTCKQGLSCAIVKFFFENQVDSFGIRAASLEAVHQIGILLGLKEESNKESDSYIMSTKRPFRGDVLWSPQSRNMMKMQLKQKSCLQDDPDFPDQPNQSKKDDNRSTFAFHNLLTPDNLPGRKQTAKAQCELFLHDEDANVVTLHDICKNLQCETPRKNESYFAGSALNGTHCALKKECYSGECVPIIEPPYNFKYCEVDRWSEWREDPCTSDCLVKSKGVRVRRRSCKHRTKRAVDCSGLYYDVVLCDNVSFCSQKRKSIVEFVTMKCTEFNKVAKKVDAVKLPIEKFQFTHDVEKPWKACTVYCRQKKISDWEASRQEMLDHGINPYFPDGTWCHKENGTNYYCRQHYCLPEIVSSVHANFWDTIDMH